MSHSSSGDVPLPWEDPFEKYEGKDGFHVVMVRAGSDISLHCVAYGGGEMQNLVDVNDPTSATVELWSRKLTPQTQGEMIRLQHALDAVARYLTLGGEWMELRHALQVMGTVAIGGMVYPGYYLHDSYVTTEGVYQHIFVRLDGDESDPAVLWEEPTFNDAGSPVGGWIDKTMTLAEIEAERADDGWEEEIQEVEAVDGAGGPSGASTLQLQDRRDPPEEERADGTPLE